MKSLSSPSPPQLPPPPTRSSLCFLGGPPHARDSAEPTPTYSAQPCVLGRIPSFLSSPRTWGFQSRAFGQHPARASRLLSCTFCSLGTQSPWLCPLLTRLPPALSSCRELTPAKESEGAEWWRRSRLASRTVVAHLRGGGAGRALKPRAFLAGDPKGPQQGVPGEPGALPQTALSRGPLKREESRAGLLLGQG